MNQLFIGVLFILFDFNLSLGNFTVGFLPDFIGYLLALIGLRELATGNPPLKKCQVLASIFFFYSIFSYISSFFGLFSNIFIAYLSGALDVILRLFFIYLLVQGFKQLETDYKIEFFTDTLHKYWALITAFQVFSLLLISSLLLSAVCMMISFVFNILFALRLNMGRINWKNGR